jgi:hypothetical protein
MATLLNPMTDMLSGHLIPASARTDSAPSAIRSFPQTIAVKSWADSSSRRVASAPAASV